MTRQRCTPEAVGYAIAAGAGRGALGALGCLLVWTVWGLAANAMQSAPITFEWEATLAFLLYGTLVAGTIGAVLGGALGLAALPLAVALTPRRAALVCGGLAASVVVALALHFTEGAEPLWLLALVPVGAFTAAAAAWHARDLSRRAAAGAWPGRVPDDGPLI